LNVSKIDIGLPDDEMAFKINSNIEAKIGLEFKAAFISSIK
jgi:hypothetical protein